VNTSNEQSPCSIEHLVDTDWNPATGECSYHYNFFLYTFQHSDGIVTARSYLDTLSEVSILKCPMDCELEEKLEPILNYLKRRYKTVKYLGPSGYITI